MTLPNEVLEAARELAGELDTSVNDAVVRLALAGTERHSERQDLARRARERRAALSALAAAETAAYPSEEEARAAVMSMRRED